MRTIWLTIFSIFAAAAFAGSASAQTVVGKGGDQFLSFITRADAAQVELQNGNADAYKELWSHGDDVSLSGGFGGTIEKGWDAVSKRLDWAGNSFSKGTNTIERIVAHNNGTLGYVVQLEPIQFVVPNTGKPASRDYRVTMIFRREKGVWRIVHRHADSQLTKQAPE